MNNKSSLTLKPVNFPELTSKKWSVNNGATSFQHCNIMKKVGPLDQLLKTGFEIKTRKLK